MLRLLLLVVAALMLGGCNLVVSEHPMFAARDAVGSTQFRPGVWASRKPDCAFDAAKPLKDWPECAGGGVLTRDRLVDRDGKEKDSAYVLAGGEPRVMQFEFRGDDKGKVLYLFMGVEPLRLDDKGRIVEARLWLAQCGPMPPKPDPAAKPAEDKPLADMTEDEIQRSMEAAIADTVTREPFEGLTVHDGMCTPRDQAAVRNAASRSLGITEPDGITTLYWVRDGKK
ncbi:MAG: hypothetical protein K1X35_03595 [Caulobacteraceae bacterium]|nr:hypothetical protein [Caulobacteraceae bacterium]